MRLLNRRVFGLLYPAVAIGLVALNVWLLARDLRPVPPLKTVSDWVRLGRYDEAEPALRAHLRRAPHNGDILQTLAKVRSARGDDLAAARLVHEIPGWWPGEDGRLLLEGQLFLGAHRARDAEAAWSRAIDPKRAHAKPFQTPVAARAAIALMKLYIAEYRNDEASSLAWQAYGAAAPSEREGLLRILVELDVLPDAPAARAATLRRYLAADPADWHARRGLALAEHALGHPDVALRLIEECRRKHPDEPILWRDLAMLHHDRGDGERFREVIDRVPAAADSVAAIWKYRGMARERAGDFDGAAAAYRRTAELGGADTESYYHLGLVEARLGHSAEAARAFARSRRFEEAKLELYATFWNYLVASKPDASPEARTAAITKLAKLRSDLGREREANAWLSLVPAPSADRSGGGHAVR